MLGGLTGRRWDGDERGEGIGDASAFVPAATRLVDAMRRANWVAEEPELHLLPHLTRACESLPLEVMRTGAAGDGSFEVELQWTADTRGIGEIRAAIFTLVGSFAEPWTYVRQRSDPEREPGELLSFDVVTGILDDQSRFEPHGHTLTISVWPRGVS
jgi:hypothetical protein